LPFEKIRVVVRGPSGKKEAGELKLRKRKGEEKVARAGAFLLFGFLAGYLCRQVPGVGELLLFALVGFGFLGAGFSIVGTPFVMGDLRCPECGQLWPVGRVPEQWPLPQACPNCKAKLTVVRSGSS
jgi:uncharacterized protein YbaR (Trm112 family)